MTYFYAVYVTFCVLGNSYCTLNNRRYDDWETYKQINQFVNDVGERPHWEKVTGDLVWTYSYGECYKGRKDNPKDIKEWIEYNLYGDCPDCSCHN